MWKNVALALAVILAGFPIPAQTGADPHDDEHRHDATVSHGFGDVERWVERFDDPARNEWQKPEHVVRFLDLPEAGVVADIGAGTGYFSVHLARAVGPEGRVYAVDVEPNLVDYLGDRAAREGLRWIEPVLTEPDAPGLPEAEVDVVLICDTWHHIDHRLEYLQKLARALRPGGRVVIIDFREGELPVGPPPGHKLSRQAVLDEFDEGGWVLEAENADLPYQYFLVFKPGP